jgi:14-3-3 protein epsilon
MGTREELAFLANLADNAGRYEDMTVYMKRIAEMGLSLSVDERNSLSLAYKNFVGAKRAAWRAISAYESRDPDQTIAGYRAKVEVELKGTCQEVIALVEKQLLPGAAELEAQVFYTKMQGDYYRYLAEFSEGGERQQAADGAQERYAQAVQLSHGLQPTNAIRLGLALNFSVFYFEVLSQPSNAIKLATETLESVSVVPQEDLDEDSMQILPLLQENLKLWMSSVSVSTGVVQDGTAVEEM